MRIYMQDGQFLLKLTFETTNYFANKQNHAMKEQDCQGFDNDPAAALV